jgi:hypothetical protein
LVIIGGVAAYFFVSGPPGFLGISQATPTPAVQNVPVVVAGQQIPKAAIIEDAMLATVQLPEDMVVAGMIREKGQVVGKYAKYQLDPGHFITTADIANLPRLRGSNGAPGSAWDGGDRPHHPPRPGCVAVRGDHVRSDSLFIDVDPVSTHYAGAGSPRRA